jgi:hypothetical protein
MKRFVFAAFVLFASITPADDSHKLQVWGGWISCEPGYTMRRGTCIPSIEIPAGPELSLVSRQPAAGERSSRPRQVEAAVAAAFHTQWNRRRRTEPANGWAYYSPSGGLPLKGGRLVLQTDPTSRVTIQLPFPW